LHWIQSRVAPVAPLQYAPGSPSLSALHRTGYNLYTDFSFFSGYIDSMSAILDKISVFVIAHIDVTTHFT